MTVEQQQKSDFMQAPGTALPMAEVGLAPKNR